MQNKVIVITGASAGIGAAVAEAASQAGAKVVLAARREAELRAVAQRCGSSALAMKADLTVKKDSERLAAAVIELHGQIDVWVNNVGRGISRPVSELTAEDVDAMIDANVKSALFGMQAVLPHFKARNAGQIINVSSMLGRVPLAPVRSAYSASKHFLNALTANLRMELFESHPGIAVCTVSPGVVTTDFGLNALHGGADSRSLPFSQTAEQVAAVILETVRTRKADVYTQERFQQAATDYYAAPDMAAHERQLLQRR